MGGGIEVKKLKRRVVGEKDFNTVDSLVGVLEDREETETGEKARSEWMRVRTSPPVL